MYRIRQLLTLAFIATLLLTACGQKGDLFLPADDSTATLTTDDGR
jgi:predicted small lipoprotein YifL